MFKGLMGLFSLMLFFWHLRYPQVGVLGLILLFRGPTPLAPRDRHRHPMRHLKCWTYSTPIRGQVEKWCRVSLLTINEIICAGNSARMRQGDRWQNIMSHYVIEAAIKRIKRYKEYVAK